VQYESSEMFRVGGRCYLHSSLSMFSRNFASSMRAISDVEDGMMDKGTEIVNPDA
jgi:hypothetical protein